MVHKLNKAPALAFLIFASQLCSCAASAQSRSKDNLAELSKVSDAIVVATCTAVESQWNYNRSLIFTKFSFAVEQVIKGDQKLKSFDLRYLGGRVGDEAMEVSHAPHFAPGKPHVLFLSAPKNTGALISKNEQEAGNWQWPRLMARAGQGKFELAKEQETGKMYVVNPPPGTASKGYAQTLEGIKHEKPQATAASGKVYLDDFVQIITAKIQ